jgi:hypothetical protein
VTSRLHAPVASLEMSNYDTLVDEALAAFRQDIVYAIEIMESACSISNKKRKVKKSN